VDEHLRQNTVSCRIAPGFVMMRAILVASVVLVFAPASAHAQLETFVQVTRAIAVAAGQPEPGRTAAMLDASSRMGAALAEWDRSLTALEARVDREAPGASTQRQYQLHIELGVAYRARGRLSDALRELDAAARLQPSASDLQLLRALTLESLGRTDASAQAFRTAWSLDPANPVKAYYARDRHGLPPAERERAQATLRDTYRRLTTAVRPETAPFLTLDAIPDTLVRTPVVGDARVAQAFGLIAAGKYSAAAAAFGHVDRSATASPDESPLTHFTRARANEAENRVSEARHEYAAALPGTLTGRSTIYVAIGRLAQVEGDQQGAVDAFTQAVRLNPNDPTMHQELAGAYAAHGLGDDAFAELIAGLLVDPASGTLHAAVGQLHLDTGHAEDAVPAFTRALELNPDRYEVRYALATALTRLGRSAEAAAQLELFERVRREMLDRRRQDIQHEIEKEDTIRRGLTTPGSAP
jgi:tetratricopeptide (TPR) repeat protein